MCLALASLAQRRRRFYTAHRELLVTLLHLAQTLTNYHTSEEGTGGGGVVAGTIWHGLQGRHGAEHPLPLPLCCCTSPNELLLPTFAAVPRCPRPSPGCSTACGRRRVPHAQRQAPAPGAPAAGRCAAAQSLTLNRSSLCTPARYVARNTRASVLTGLAPRPPACRCHRPVSHAFIQSTPPPWSPMPLPPPPPPPPPFPPTHRRSNLYNHLRAAFAPAAGVEPGGAASHDAGPAGLPARPVSAPDGDAWGGGCGGGAVPHHGHLPVSAGAAPAWRLWIHECRVMTMTDMLPGNIAQ